MTLLLRLELTFRESGMRPRTIVWMPWMSIPSDTFWQLSREVRVVSMMLEAVGSPSGGIHERSKLGRAPEVELSSQGSAILVARMRAMCRGTQWEWTQTA
jgi:hypothetical protein